MAIKSSVGTSIWEDQERGVALVICFGVWKIFRLPDSGKTEGGISRGRGNGKSKNQGLARGLTSSRSGCSIVAWE